MVSCPEAFGLHHDHDRAGRAHRRRELARRLAVVPQDPPANPSSNMGRGNAADYFKTLAADAKLLEKPEARHAALILLQQEARTHDVLGPVEAALRPDLIRLLSDDLKAVAWADIT